MNAILIHYSCRSIDRDCHYVLQWSIEIRFPVSSQRPAVPLIHKVPIHFCIVFLYLETAIKGVDRQYLRTEETGR